MYLQIDTFSPNPSQLLLCVCITAWLQQVCDIDCILFWRICQSIQWISPFTDSPFRGVSVDSPISHLQLFSQNSIPHCCTRVCFHTESCHHSVSHRRHPYRRIGNMWARGLVLRLTLHSSSDHCPTPGTSQISKCGIFRFQNGKETKNDAERETNQSRLVSRYSRTNKWRHNDSTRSCGPDLLTSSTFTSHYRFTAGFPLHLFFMQVARTESVVRHSHLKPREVWETAATSSQLITILSQRL